MTKNTSQSLIARSTEHTEIIHAEGTSELHGQLRALSEGHVEHDGIVEYWGTDDELGEWRIHLTSADELVEVTMYRVETITDGIWDSAAVGAADANRFETEAEAAAAIVELRTLGSDWAEAEYRVVQI